MTNTVSNDSQVALGANVASTLYGVTGTSVKIGVISDSYNNLGGAAADVTAGNLPSNVTVVSDDPSGGTDEGRAIIELAYKIAPGAQYYFATGASTITDFATAVTALQNAGCSIIVDDLSYGTDESFFQTGTVLDTAIEAAVSAGIDYFSAAGNDGTDYYQGGYAGITQTISGIGSNLTLQNFGASTSPSPYLNVTIPKGSSPVSIAFEWAQPFQSIGSGSKSAANSFALYLLDSNGNIVASSTSDQVGANPTQYISFVNTSNSTSFRLVAAVDGGTPATGEVLKMISPNGLVSFGSNTTGSGDIYGHELLANTNTVGAVSYASTPAFGQSPTTPASFTSVGPGQLLYTSTGKAQTVTLSKPNFVAAQGSNTTVPGFAPFNGTSAAAPNAAAVGALMLQVNPNLTTSQMTALLDQSAIPVTTTLANVGAGLIQARAAVELSDASAGSRWTASAGGDWKTAGNWSTAPTSSTSAMLGDNLGAFTATYTAKVDTAGDVAGSLTVGTGSGSSATLSVQAGGSLSIGGSNTNNPTAGDLLVSNNGTVSVQAGSLAITGSLNNNNGSVTLTGGTTIADNYAQNSGSFTLGGSGTVTLLLTGGGWNVTGGSGQILTGGALMTTTVTDSSATLSVSGTLTDNGTLSSGTAGGAATINLSSGGVFSIGSTASGVGVGFSTGGMLVFSSTDATTLQTGLTSLISGFTSQADDVDFTGLIYNMADTYNYSNGQLSIVDGNTTLANLMLNPAATYSGFSVTKDSGNGVLVTAACFCPGTNIATPEGESAIETLAIGDIVQTASGAAAPILWIGHRSYGQRFVASRPQLLPVRIKAGALGKESPKRDLVISPEHAMLIDELLVPARLLVNGTTITREQPQNGLQYLHIELDQHDIILAEGAPTETFVDDDSRAMFHNAAEFGALYPDRRPQPAIYCTHRVEGGYELEAIRRRLSVIAGELARAA